MSALVWMLSACGGDSHTSRGQAALDAHDLPSAEQHFRDALAREPEHVEALNGLGWTYLVAGERGGARAAFERCLVVEAQQVSCLRGMANIALTEGTPGIARGLLEDAKRVAPEHPDVEHSLALLDLVLGDEEAAEARFVSLVRRHPERIEFRLGLAEVRLRDQLPFDVLKLVEEGLDDKDLSVRHQAMLLQLQARALVAATAGRSDPTNCGETMPALMAWIDAADRSLDLSETEGVDLPEKAVVRRLVARRRATLEDECPGWLERAGGSVFLD